MYNSLQVTNVKAAEGLWGCSVRYSISTWGWTCRNFSYNPTHATKHNALSSNSATAAFIRMNHRSHFLYSTAGESTSQEAVAQACMEHLEHIRENRGVIKKDSIGFFFSTYRCPPQRATSAGCARHHACSWSDAVRGGSQFALKQCRNLKGSYNTYVISCTGEVVVLLEIQSTTPVFLLRLTQVWHVQTFLHAQTF